MDTATNPATVAAEGSLVHALAKDGFEASLIAYNLAGDCWKVEPISPTLTSVKVTEAVLASVCKAFATPDSNGQGPRETPGNASSLSIWFFTPSSQSIRLRLSSHMDMVSTMPRCKASPMDFKPPFFAKV